MPDTQPTTLSLAAIDIDGAVRDTAAALPTRAQFIRRGAGAAALGGLTLGLLPSTVWAKSAKSDFAILNFALVLEYLQASFYTQAEQVGALTGPLAEQATVVGSHERAHVKALQTVLGSAAIKEPKFNFHGVTDNANTFRSTAVAFEDLAVRAYKQQLPLIRANAYLAAAVSIHSVEARHAAWIRRLAGIVPSSSPFDDPLGDRRVVDIVNSTKFVTLKAPSTSASRSPSFTG